VNKEEYKQYLDSQYWAMLRRIKLEEADHRCQLCGTGYGKGVQLEVHHNTYERCPFREKLSDLVVLCSRCHRVFGNQLPDEHNRGR